jgi:putative ABC transport system permease protein
MANWNRDVRFGLRMLARNKGFAAIAILALALGIGPNVAIFSIIWATFLAPLPYPNANQLVVVWTHYKGERDASRAEDYAELAVQSQSFQRLDFQSWNGLHLTNSDHSQDETRGLPTTPGFYTKNFGIPMALGRDFLPDEGTPGKDHLVILTHRLWESRFHADPDILGKPILIDDEAYTVVGVIQAGPSDRVEGTQFVVPFRPQQGVPSQQIGNVFGRLKPGVTVAQAQAEIALIDSRLAPKRNGGAANAKSWSVSVEQLKNDWLDPKLVRNLWLLLAAVGLVLLIACANVANLLLARGSARQQELALRTAMGATRRQVFEQLLIESLTLAVLGGGIGVAMGWSIMKIAMAILPLAKQTAEAVVGINVPVLCFAVGVSLIGGVLFGCAPAWQAAKLNLSETLKQGSRAISGRSRSRTQGILVTAEFALALTLLAGAGMALHSFWNLSRIDLGVTTDHILTANMQPRGSSGQSHMAIPAPEQIVASQRLLIEKLRAVPGVEDAALTTSVPLLGYGTFPFAIAGQPVDKQHPTAADFEALTPGFFHTFGVRVARGRLLSDSDGMGTPLAVMVNEAFASRYLAGMDPLAQRLLLARITPTNNGPPQLGPPEPFQIVGVFHDIRNDQHLTGAVQPEMVISLWQVAWPYVAIGVRTGVDPGATLSGLRSTVADVMPNFALTQVQTMREIVDNQLTGDRFGMVLFAGFAGVALLLAALGIYGVMSFAVAQRTHEIGLRMALGAQKSEVVGLIVRGGIRMAVPGMAIGLAGVLVLGRLMHSTLYGVGAIDYGSTALVAAVLFAVGLVACWVPARRSAQVDPMIALRDE